MPILNKAVKALYHAANFIDYIIVI